MTRRAPGARRFGRLSTAACTIAFALGLMSGGVLPARAQTRPPSRLDPRLRSLKSKYESALAARVSPRDFIAQASVMFPDLKPMAADGRVGVDCLIVADETGRASLEKLGLDVRTWTGQVAVVTVPLNDVELLEDQPGVRYVEASRPLKRYLNVSGPLVGATNAHGSSQPPYPGAGFTGRSVVVGVVDTGIDITHEDFLKAGLTRIERLWDQTSGDGAAPSPWNYGSEYTADDINGGGVTETDDDGHGSHVMGIAAGSGAATGNFEPAYQYVGIAPDATLMAVKTDFTTTGVADGVAWLFNRATGHDCVINLSLGTQDGPHDGTSAFDVSIGNMTGAGRIIVAAAGNEAGSGAHARLPLSGTVGDSVVFTFVVPAYVPNGGTQNDYLLVDGWYEGSESISFRIESPNGRRSAEILVGQQRTVCLPAAGGDGRLYIENAISTPLNGDREIYFDITDWPNSPSCGSPRAGIWKIIAYRKAALASPSPINFWIANAYLGSAGAYPEFADGVSDDYLVGSPASAPGVISVGAFISKRQWTSVIGGRQYVGLTDADLGRIASFSSPGPLRNGTVAPIVSAPGMGIGSARSVSVPANSGTNPYFLTDTKHMINQGTSQASPHVAGAVALILEHSPHEDPATIVRRLSNTSTHDAFTGSVPNNLFGWGKLDALAALQFDTPVALASFQALSVAGGVRLEWSLGGDDPAVGFHVLRASSLSGPFTRLTTEPLTGGPDYGFDDSTVEPGRDYWYQLEAIEVDGSLTRFGPYRATPGAPRLSLAQNLPNPFTGRTTIAYSLPAGGPVRLRVFDVSGRLVRTLIDGPAAAGAGQVEWDGLTDEGRTAGNGLYFYMLESASGVVHRKMLLTR